MKSYRKELWFDVPTRRAFINITPQVVECLKKSGAFGAESTLKQGKFLESSANIKAKKSGELPGKL